MRFYIIIIIFAFGLLACNNKNSNDNVKKESITKSGKSEKEYDIKNLKVDNSSKEVKSTVDSVEIKSSDGNTLRLKIYSYHESLPNRPIKDFAAFDKAGNNLMEFDGTSFIFEEDGPFEEDEYLEISPCFYLIDSLELKIKLQFHYNYNLKAYKEIINIPFRKIFNHSILTDRNHDLVTFVFDSQEDTISINKKMICETQNPKNNGVDALYADYLKLSHDEYHTQYCLDVLSDMFIYTFNGTNPYTIQFLKNYSENLKLHFEHLQIIDFYIKYLD